LAKHKDRSPLGNWEVHLTGVRDESAVAAGTWWRRDKWGGYTFYDSEGAISSDFPPGSVDYVRRMPASGFGGGGDYAQESGVPAAATYSVTVGPGIAEELIRDHVGRHPRERGGDYSEAAQ
jgi:hypothetical protein